MPSGTQWKRCLGAAGWLLICLLVLSGFSCTSDPPPEAEEGFGQGLHFTGSDTCRGCHEDFYKLWAPSLHGLAMQPFTDEFAENELVSQITGVQIGDYSYLADLGPGKNFVRETGPDGEAIYWIEHALGGKNIYYFLTPVERGRLQVLPVAYDVRRKEWFDTTSSMTRHFTDIEDEALDWRESPLTFNTSCYSCHVSQLSTNYNLETDTYNTVWAEPGINCETCHGPASEHVEVCMAAPRGTAPEDVKIILQSEFTVQESNDTCAPCHAKMNPLTADFQPGERYFDHFDLHTVEHRDFYPDGRDLGENYTWTLWKMSPCTQNGEFGCIHCHTSSGRNRHTGDQADNACLPCHEEIVQKPAEHSHHAADSTGSRCIACHMPKTEFARMLRHDHTMLPPTPAATIAFESPNACNICHADQDAKWSDRWVRKWYPRDYQKPLMERARLIEAGRKRDWTRLPEMLDYLQKPDRNEIFATSLVRLLQNSPDDRKWPVLTSLLDDPSPLVRSAVATALGSYGGIDGRKALVKATGDESRLVRLRAAAALAVYPREMFSADEWRQVESSFQEYEASLNVRQDEWSSHYNRGNYFVNRGRSADALKAYETAAQLQPRAVPPLVNASMIHARMGQPKVAEEKLRKALQVEPESPGVTFNLGLLVAEQGNLTEAEELLRAALKADPEMAEAAYNLGVLLSAEHRAEAIQYCRRAAEIRPGEPKYAYTLAFFLNQEEQAVEAGNILEDLIRLHPSYSDGYALLGSIYERQNRVAEAQRVYRQALSGGRLSPAERNHFEAKVRQ